MSSVTMTNEVWPGEPWHCGPPLSREQYWELLRCAIFECCKWHIEVEDKPALCPFPLVLTEATWKRLAGLAEELANELLAAERELLERPGLYPELGLPSALCGKLRRYRKPCGNSPRVMRFDFHWTTSGWQISEANTDVAGGFIEASGVSQLMADLYPGYRPAGDPAGALSSAIREYVGPGGRVGLMHLTTYIEDGQIMLYLARRLKEQGLATCLFHPEQLRCIDGRIGVASDDYTGRVDLVLRFYPAEWLLQLPRWIGWFELIGASAVCNPVHAVLTQSKRFPLIWDPLGAALPTWRALLPETRGPDCFRPDQGDGWVLKPALGHEGYNIGVPGVTEPHVWRRIMRSIRCNPKAWALQRPFVPVAQSSPEGLLFPCLGIYVINGKAAGAFGRMASRPLIDDRSREVVVLVKA